jgi:hemolysin activation/secretion protein
MKSIVSTVQFLALGGIALLLTSAAMAESLPGPADAARIKPIEGFMLPDYSKDPQVNLPTVFPQEPVPDAAKTIHLTLKSVTILGATAFKVEQLQDIYAPYVDKDVTLDTAWTIAAAITERYRNAGYFLSRAFVPQQSIKDGNVQIKVVEGYIGKVELPEDVSGNSVVNGFVEQLQAQKPVTAEGVESILLRLNDLPGYAFRAVLSPLENNGEEAAIRLTLILKEKDGQGSVSFDNQSSRYLGPNEVSGTYSISLVPLQQTSISEQSGLPEDRIQYGMISHKMVLAPDIAAEFSGGLTRAYPGYSLSALNIRSISSSEALSLDFQWIRQRQENLSFKLTVDHRDVTTHILDSVLTRDHIHTARASIDYDRSDE